MGNVLKDIGSFVTEYLIGHRSMYEVGNDLKIMRKLHEEGRIRNSQEDEFRDTNNRAAMRFGFYVFSGKILPNLNLLVSGIYAGVNPEAEWQTPVAVGESMRIGMMALWYYKIHPRVMFQEFFHRHSLEKRVAEIEQEPTKTI